MLDFTIVSVTMDQPITSVFSIQDLLNIIFGLLNPRDIINFIRINSHLLDSLQSVLTIQHQSICSGIFSETRRMFITSRLSAKTKWSDNDDRNAQKEKVFDEIGQSVREDIWYLLNKWIRNKNIILRHQPVFPDKMSPLEMILKSLFLSLENKFSSARKHIKSASECAICEPYWFNKFLNKDSLSSEPFIGVPMTLLYLCERLQETRKVKLPRFEPEDFSIPSLDNAIFVMHALNSRMNMAYCNFHIEFPNEFEEFFPDSS